MKNTSQILCITLCCAIGAAAGEPGRKEAAQFAAAIEKLRPLHKKISKPGPNDWLAHHKEPGQTFREYLRYKPVTAHGKRNIIYIQPLGAFTESQRRIVKTTAEFMALFYDVEVKIKKDIPLSAIPAKARRVHPRWGMKQVLTSYVLHSVLKPRLPADAAAYIAFTGSDLWPGEGWNFVFGEASIRERVGVWSIYRNGDPEKSSEDYTLCLRRTLKTAVHETGHMFSMLHCTKYECCMCGSNHREESDRRPLWFCPECVAKVWWATGADPAKRYTGLSEFCAKHKLAAESDFYKKCAFALKPKATNK